MRFPRTLGVILAGLTLFVAPSAASAQAVWQVVDAPTTAILRDVFFVDESLGFVGGDGLILRTDDGGWSWTQIELDSTFLQLDCQSFAQASCDTLAPVIRRIDFQEDGVGIAVAGQYVPYLVRGGLCCSFIGVTTILRTADWGQTWNGTLTLDNSAMFSGCFVTRDRAIVAGHSGTYFISEDRGLSWTRHGVFPLTRFFDLHCGKDELVWAASIHVTGPRSATEIIHASNDGGTSWTSVPVRTARPNQFDLEYHVLGGLAAINDGIVFAVHHVSVLQSQDGGKTWITRPASEIRQLLDLHLSDEQSLTAAGSRGTIVRSNDGGVSWTPEASPTQNDLLSVFMIDDRNVVAVGREGTILRTETGGVVATSQDAPEPRLSLDHYPNPAVDRVTIRHPNRSNEVKPASIEIFDVIGRVVKHNSTDLFRSREVRLNVSDLPDGVYMYRTSDGGVGKPLVIAR